MRGDLKLHFYVQDKPSESVPLRDATSHTSIRKKRNALLSLKEVKEGSRLCHSYLRKKLIEQYNRTIGKRIIGSTKRDG